MEFFGCSPPAVSHKNSRPAGAAKTHVRDAKKSMPREIASSAWDGTGIAGRFSAR